MVRVQRIPRIQNALATEKFPVPHSVLEHHLHGVSEAVDEDPLEDDHQLEHELGPGLQESLNGAQICALLRPPTVTSRPDHPVIKDAWVIRHEIKDHCRN